MKSFLSERFAANSILFILITIIGFHFLVIAGVIPYQIVWGGRLENETQMLQFETVSIALNILMVAIVAIKAGYLKLKLHATFLKVIFVLMAALFALNTIGNLLAKNELEKLIFTPLTFLLAIFCFRLALSKTSKLESEALKS